MNTVWSYPGHKRENVCHKSYVFVTKISFVLRYAPVPLDPRRNPVAMSRITSEALLYAESTRQVWRWTLPRSLDGGSATSQGGESGGFWKQTFIGWPPQWRTNVTFASAFDGFLFLLGGHLADASGPADSTMWMTSNRSIEAVSPPACPETCYGSDCDFWFVEKQSLVVFAPIPVTCVLKSWPYIL